MARRIVVAPDSFKGTISSQRIVELFRDAFRDDPIEILGVPISDGGENFVDSIRLNGIPGTVVQTHVTGPFYGQKVPARYFLSRKRALAVIEMAEAAGLNLVPPKDRDPSLATTYGVGELISDAIRRGAKELIIGIGGSATNDCGAGMASALGFKFLDSDGKEIKEISGESLRAVSEVVAEDTLAIRMISSGTVKVLAACDVDNPLLGPRGAARIYAEQKGADSAMIEELETGAASFAAVLERQFPHAQRVATLPGGGASGGLGAGLAVFCRAELKRGIELLLDTVKFDERVSDPRVALVVTGEGSLDEQTLSGKAPMGVLERATAAGKPVIAISGICQDQSMFIKKGFSAVYSVVPKHATLRESLSRPEEGFKKILGEIKDEILGLM